MVDHKLVLNKTDYRQRNFFHKGLTDNLTLALRKCEASVDFKEIHVQNQADGQPQDY